MRVDKVITKYELLSKILLKNGSDELSKDLKVKLLSMRIEYGKIARQYMSDFDEFAKSLKTQDVIDLANKEGRSDEENAELKRIVDTINEAYATYVNSRVVEEAQVSDKRLTTEELDEIIVVNIDNDVVINEQVMSAADFIENLQINFGE